MSNDWIITKIKNKITKRNKLFQNWIKCPNREKQKYLQKPKEPGDIKKMPIAKAILINWEKIQAQKRFIET